MRYIWQHADWSNFTWQSDQLLDAVSKARFSQGKLLSKVNSLGMKLSREAQAEILTEETVQTAAIEGETLDRDSVRSSVSKRLGLPIAGLPAAGRHVDGLVDVLMDATMYYKKPLTAKRLKSWQAAYFQQGFQACGEFVSANGGVPNRCRSYPAPSAMKEFILKRRRQT